MDWPPYSPDLNLIKNLWAIIKAEIYQLHLELQFMADIEETLRLLIEAAKEAWHEIKDRVLYNLSITMYRRVEAVIAADGWYTKY
jgi:transposase